MYTCEKCGKVFKHKGRYTRHLNKIKPCISQTKLNEFVKQKVQETINDMIITLSTSLDKSLR